MLSFKFIYNSAWTAVHILELVMDLQEFPLNAFKNFSASQLLTGEDKCLLAWRIQEWWFLFEVSISIRCLHEQFALKEMIQD